MPNETPDTVHGRLMESAHIAGYSLERALKEFEWLLENNRWKQCSNGFDNIDDFLITINFSEFTIAIEKRKEIAKKLSDMRATQRAIAKALNAGRSTINRDLKLVPNGTKQDNQVEEYKELENEVVPNGTLSPIIEKSGAEIIQTTDRIIKKQIRKEEFKSYHTPVLPDGKYYVLYADPPWEYNNSGFEESAQSKYPTMSTKDICELPVQNLIGDKAVLFLWVTNAFLREGLQVCEAWGFKYKTNCVWIKNRGPSIGWFTKSRHELLFICTKWDFWGNQIPEN